jgi:phenylacetate-CoA ligase
VSTPFTRPWEAVDYTALVAAYPPPPEYYDGGWLAPADEIERVQLERLRARALRAADVPFFGARWEEAGFDPRTIESLDDLGRAPAYTVDDIRRSIEEHPPWGDYQGVTPADARREPVRVFMSGGTTGQSRPTFYTQWDR